MYRKKMALTTKVFIAVASAALGVAVTAMMMSASAQPRIATTSSCSGAAPTAACLKAAGFSPTAIASTLAHLPTPLHCTVTLDTVEAGPGTSLSNCIAVDPNIPHPAVNEPAAANLAAANPTYPDGTPTLACPSWGSSGGEMAVPEGTKLCPPPPGMKALTPAQVNAAFKAA
jgi:hypothetical protein